MQTIMLFIVFIVWMSAAAATSIALIKSGHWVAGTIVFVFAMMCVRIRSGD